MQGTVSFDKDGIRADVLLLIRQVRYDESSKCIALFHVHTVTLLLKLFCFCALNSAQQFVLTDIGSGTRAGVNTTFQYIDGWTDETIWPGT